MADLGKYVVAVVGPTASGKTELGIRIAEKLNGEIVSADSMQIYKGMDIASAKPTFGELSRARHHLVSFVENSCPYSVADYCDDAEKAVNDIISRGKLPVMVGGTGLYVDCFLNNISFSNEETDEKLRKELSSLSNQELMQRLMKIDPEYADKLNLNDTKRIIRGLEVYIKTNKTMSETLIESRKSERKYRPIYIGLNFSQREKLYDRINKRVDIMLEKGLVDEARSSFEDNAGSTFSQAIGHKELYPYFMGEESLDVCVEKLKQSTRRYAKRQLSWFRRNKNINWFFADNMSMDDITEKAINLINTVRKEDY